MTEKEIRARYDELRRRRGELLRAGEKGEALARVEEDLNDARRALRARQGAQRVRVQSWSVLEHAPWDGLAQRTWDDLEESREHRAMRESLHRARRGLTGKQEAYLTAVDSGVRPSAAARAAGVAPSTVTRTVERARAQLKREAQRSYALHAAGKGPAEGCERRLDLRRPGTCAAVLECLTPRQQLYLTLRYGEGMGVREIGRLLEVDHAAVLRGIRRGLERICGQFEGENVVLENMEVLEDLLVEYYASVPSEDEKAPAQYSGGHPGKRGSYRSRTQMLRHAEQEVEELPIRCAGGTGKLRAWLEKLRAEQGESRPGRALRRLLLRLTAWAARCVTRRGNET